MRSALDDARRARLEAFGVRFGLRDEEWERNFRLLLEFRTRAGRCDVPKEHVRDHRGAGAANSQQGLSNPN